LGYFTIWNQVGFCDAATLNISALLHFYDLVNLIIFGILIFVVYVIGVILFRDYINKFLLDHNIVEVIWTVIPIFIIGILTVLSLTQLYLREITYSSNPRFILKYTGIQWYWGFEVQDFRKRDYTSDLASNRLSDQYICNEDYEPDLGKNKFIAHNNDSIDAPVIPQGSIARILVTRKDVIHCLGINSFGVKLDAIPGRSSATYLHTTYTGNFYGLCIELCGSGHSHMPVTIRVIKE